MSTGYSCPLSVVGRPRGEFITASVLFTLVLVLELTEDGFVFLTDSLVGTVLVAVLFFLAALFA